MITTPSLFDFNASLTSLSLLIKKEAPLRGFSFVSVNLIAKVAVKSMLVILLTIALGSMSFNRACQVSEFGFDGIAFSSQPKTKETEKSNHNSNNKLPFSINYD